MKKITLATGAVLFLLAALYYLFAYEKSWEQITLGASLPLSGINKDLGQEVLEGADAYFKYANAHGGIHGKPIRFLHYDDKYEPQNTIRNTQKLILEDQVFALFGFVGTPTTKAILPMIEKVPLIAPYTGAAVFRRGDNPCIVNFRSSYGEEIDHIVAYLYQQKKIRRFAVFYQNDDYGIAGYNAAVKALKKRKLTLSAEGTYRRNTLSIAQALHEIAFARPEAILLVGAYKPTAHFIRSWRKHAAAHTLFAPISFVNADALIRELDYRGENIYFSLTVPSYDDRQLGVANSYREILATYYPSAHPSYASFESFLAAKAVVSALRDIPGAITRQRFIRRLKAIQPDAIGHLPIAYRHTQLLNQVYLSVFGDGKFRLLDKERR